MVAGGPRLSPFGDRIADGIRHYAAVGRPPPAGTGTDLADMCGIVGIVSHGPVNQAIYDSLAILQHRGQDAAGIMTDENGQLNLRKSNGLVRDVFEHHHMMRLTGNIGIGHVRYPTAGSASIAEAQPFLRQFPVRYSPGA